LTHQWASWPAALSACYPGSARTKRQLWRSETAVTLRHRVRTSGRSSDLYYNTCSLASRHVCSRRAREGGSVRTAAAMSGRIRREGGGTGVHVLAIVMGQRRQTLLACAHGPLGSLLRAQRGSVSRFANRKSARASSGERLCTASRMTRLSTNWQPMLAARMTESLAGRVALLRLLPPSLDLAQSSSSSRRWPRALDRLLNLSEPSRDLGIAVDTAKQWPSLLEATSQVVVLRPHHA